MKKLIIFILCTMLNAAAFANDVVRIIVPVGPGATVDELARIVAPALSKHLNKTVIVENKPGGSGIVAMENVASATPDGLTLIMTNNGLTNIAPILQPNIGYTSSSFTSVGVVGVSPLVLVVSSQNTTNNLKELTEGIKKGNKASWASSSVGTAPHLLGEIYKDTLSLDIVNVMYKTFTQAMIDVSENRVTMLFDTPNSKILGLIDTNKMKPIAVTSKQRLAELPNVPTVSEQGFSFLTASVWFGLAVPSTTPQPITTSLVTAMTAVLKDQEVKEKLKKAGMEQSPASPSDSQKYIDSERERWGTILKKSKVKLD
jgi:tripartite-type tricarboxylate transporter receptor subunit TctC